jgi:hypothetical protein
MVQHAYDASVATKMYPLVKPLTRDHEALASGKAPVIVSDSVGPLPRLNLRQELEDWGSDPPAGTLVETTKAGVVAIRPVFAFRPAPGANPPRIRTKPRLAVALDYLQVMKKHFYSGPRVFSEIWLFLPRPLWMTPEDERRTQLANLTPGEQARPVEVAAAIPRTKLGPNAPAHIDFTFAETFPVDAINLTRIILYAKPSTDPSCRWTRIESREVKTDPDEKTARARLDAQSGRSLLEWCHTPGPGRFISLRFAASPTAREVFDKKKVEAIQERYNCDDPWNVQAHCTPLLSKGYPNMVSAYRIRLEVEMPDFAWRRKFKKYQ